MGIDFDENGKNDEYEADENESTGEPDDPGRTPPPRPAPVATAAPIMAGNAQDLLSAIMGTTASQAQPQTAEEAIQVSEDTYMDEVDKRLELASYYRLLLRDSLFQNTSEAAMVVDHEVRGFVRERLGILVGARAASKEVPPLFSPEQVEVLKLVAELTPIQLTALKMIAGKVLGVSPTSEPPAAPTVVPKAAPKIAPAAPAIAKRSAPVAPVLAQPATPPTTEQRRPGPGRTPGLKGKPKLVEKVPAVRKYADGSEEPLLDAKGNPIMVAVARRQRPEGMLPFPNEAQMSQVTAIQAGDRIQKLESNPEARKALGAIANS